jgi:predicted secreted Zn-dependent protease
MHRTTSDTAITLWKWFKERGGICVWKSVNLSNLGMSWTTPMKTADGGPPVKPTWQAENEPSETITDPAQVVVDVPKEVKRFRVGVRMGSGLTMKCTDAASRRIEREKEKAGENSWHEFDYYTQEAVIFVPGESQPLPEFIAATALGEV